MSRISKMETSKKVMWACMVQGWLCIYLSYILAFIGREQIAESLASAIVTEIIGVVLAYCIKSAVENLSKNNQWPDKPGGKEPDNENDSSETGQS